MSDNIRMNNENKDFIRLKVLRSEPLTGKMSDLINFNQMGIVEPNLRIKQLVNSGSNVTVDPNQPVLR